MGHTATLGPFPMPAGVFLEQPLGPNRPTVHSAYTINEYGEKMPVNIPPKVVEDLSWNCDGGCKDCKRVCYAKLDYSVSCYKCEMDICESCWSYANKNFGVTTLFEFRLRGPGPCFKAARAAPSSSRAAAMPASRTGKQRDMEEANFQEAIRQSMEDQAATAPRDGEGLMSKLMTYKMSIGIICLVFAIIAAAMFWITRGDGGLVGVIKSTGGFSPKAKQLVIGVTTLLLMGYFMPNKSQTDGSTTRGIFNGTLGGSSKSS